MGPQYGIDMGLPYRPKMLRLATDMHMLAGQKIGFTEKILISFIG